jgi:hypothetical protein
VGVEAAGLEERRVVPTDAKVFANITDDRDCLGPAADEPEGGARPLTRLSALPSREAGEQRRCASDEERLPRKRVGFIPPEADAHVCEPPSSADADLLDGDLGRVERVAPLR